MDGQLNLTDARIDSFQSIDRAVAAIAIKSLVRGSEIAIPKLIAEFRGSG
jgi:hypothetical protein